MKTSIVFAALGIIFLASACDVGLRTRPVHVEGQVEVRHDRDNHDHGDHDRGDHHDDHR